MNSEQPARQPHHCDHECVCKEYREWYEHVAKVIDEPCPGIMDCPHDTRPHTSATAPGPDVDCHSCKFGEQCRPTSYIPPCYNHGPDSPAAAAKAAREQVLEIIEGCIVAKGFIVVDQDDPVVSIPDLDRCIQSLRSQQEAVQPKEE